VTAPSLAKALLAQMQDAGSYGKGELAAAKFVVSGLLD
jgi:hypothetical protein